MVFTVRTNIHKDFHLGVYGLIEQKGEILVVRKSRGPYKDLYDLPGGRPYHGELLLEALIREVREETGIKTSDYSLFDNFSLFVPYQDSEGDRRELYHIALVYRTNNVDLKDFNSAIVHEDVNGSSWRNWHNIRKGGISPLLRRVLEEYEKTK